MQAKGREKDEELALFFDMRRREKENEESNNISHLSSEQLDLTSLESGNNEISPISKCLSSLPLQRRSRDEFLNSENEKSDYDWLLTPPGTPLVSLEMESQKNEPISTENPAFRPVALRSRPSNIQVEPVLKKSIASKYSALPSELNSSFNRLPDGSKPVTRRSSTPTARPSRSSTPSSRPTLSSVKTVPTSQPARFSTPTRSSSRVTTPTPRPPASLSVSASSGVRASSASKSRPASSRGSVPSRVPSPTVKSRAPPNQKTTISERPASASRARPVGPGIVKSSSTVSCSNGRPRQQSCSPSRARVTHNSSSNNSVANIGNSFRAMTRSRCGDADEVSPVVMGTKMVERVVNMRKLAPPKREDDSSSCTHNISSDSLGLGRTLSKKSLDMAMRHMDIRRSMQGNSLRPSLTNIPASSMYSIRSGPAKNITQNHLDYHCSTSSDAGSEPSVTNVSV